MIDIHTFWKRLISTSLIAMLMATYIVIPTDSQASDEPTVSLVALLVEKELLGDLTLVPVPDDIKKNNPSGPALMSVGKRIETYAEDIQQKLPNTRVLIIPVSGAEETWKIREALQNLYRNGDGGKEKTVLKGTVFIGGVPLPLITKDNATFVSLYPYTDFDDPAFHYNFDTQQFEETDGHGIPQPEVWHGVITYPVSQEQYIGEADRQKALTSAKETRGDGAVNELLNTYKQEYKAEMLKGIAEYFDKNHSFYTGGSYADFSKKALYVDLFREMNTVSGFGIAGYEAYLDNWENKSYLRYTKDWLNSLRDLVVGSSSITSHPFGVRADGTPKTQEEYIKEMEREIDANPNMSAEKKQEAKEYLKDNAESTSAIATNLATGGVLSTTLPDIFTRDPIEEILHTAVEVFSAVSGNHIQFFQNTGRWSMLGQLGDREGFTIYKIVAALDEQSRNFIKDTNTALEDKLDQLLMSAAEKSYHMQLDIPTTPINYFGRYTSYIAEQPAWDTLKTGSFFNALGDLFNSAVTQTNNWQFGKAPYLDLVPYPSEAILRDQNRYLVQPDGWDFLNQLNAGGTGVKKYVPYTGQTYVKIVHHKLAQETMYPVFPQDCQKSIFGLFSSPQDTCYTWYDNPTPAQEKYLEFYSPLTDPNIDAGVKAAAAEYYRLKAEIERVEKNGSGIEKAGLGTLRGVIENLQKQHGWKIEESVILHVVDLPFTAAECSIYAGGAPDASVVGGVEIPAYIRGSATTQTSDASFDGTVAPTESASWRYQKARAQVLLEVAPIERRIKSLEERLRNAKDPDPEWVKSMQETINRAKDELVAKTKEANDRWNAYYNVTEGDVTRFGAYYQFLERVGASDNEYPQVVEQNRLYNSSKDAFLVEKEDGSSYVDPATLTDPSWYGYEDEFANSRPSSFTFPDFLDSRRHGYLGGCSASNVTKVEDPATSPTYTHPLRSRLESQLETLLEVQREYLGETELSFEKLVRYSLGPIGIWEAGKTAAATNAYVVKFLTQVTQLNQTLTDLLYDTSFNTKEHEDDPFSQIVGEFQSTLNNQEKVLLPRLGATQYASFNNDVKTIVKTGLAKAMEVEDGFKSARVKSEEERRNENKRVTINPADFGVQKPAQTFEVWNGEGKDAAIEFIYAVARERYMNRLADYLASQEVPEQVYREMQDTALTLIRAAVSAKGILDGEVMRVMLIRSKEQALILKGLICDPIRALMPIEDPAGSISPDDAAYIPLRTTNPTVSIRSANRIEPDSKGALSVNDIKNDNQNQDLDFSVKDFTLGLIPGQVDLGRITEGGKALSNNPDQRDQYTHASRTRDPRTGNENTMSTPPSDDFYTSARSGFTIVSENMDTSVKTITTQGQYEVGYQACLRYARYGVDPSLVDAVAYKQGELERQLEEKVSKRFSLGGITETLGKLFENPLALLIPPVLPGNAWMDVFGKEIESATSAMEDIMGTAKYMIPKSLFTTGSGDDLQYMKDVNDPARRRELYSIHGLRRIATVVPHKEPTNETIARQLAAGTTPSLPVDAPRYVDFYLYEPIPEVNQYGEVIKWNEYEEHVRIPYLNFFKLYDQSKVFTYKMDTDRTAFLSDQSTTVQEVEKMLDGFNNYLVDYVAKTALSGPGLANGDATAFQGNPRTTTGLENIKFDKDDFYQTVINTIPESEKGSNAKETVQRKLAFSVYWQHLSLAEKYKFVMHNYMTSAPKAEVTDPSFFSQTVNYTTGETKQKIGFESATVIIPEKDATTGVVALEKLSKDGQLRDVTPKNALPLAQIPATTEERCDPTYRALGGSKYGVPIENWGTAMFCWVRTNFPPLEQTDSNNHQRFKAWADGVDQTVQNAGGGVDRFFTSLGDWTASTTKTIGDATGLVVTGLGVATKEVANFLGDMDMDGLSTAAFPPDTNIIDPDTNKNAIRDGQDAVGKILVSAGGGELLLDEEKKALELANGSNIGVLKMGSSNPLSVTAALTTAAGEMLWGNNYDYVELSIVEGDSVIQVLDSQKRQRVVNGVATFNVFPQGNTSGNAKVKVTLVRQPIPNSAVNFERVENISAELPIHVTDESLSAVFNHIPCSIEERESNTCARPDIKDAKPDNTFLATEGSHIFSIVASSLRNPTAALQDRNGTLKITYYRDKVSKDTLYKEVFGGRDQLEVQMKAGIWQGAIRVPKDAGLYIVDIQPEANLKLSPLRLTFNVIHSEYTSFDLQLTPNVVIDGDTVTMTPVFTGADGKPVQKLLGSASIGVPKTAPVALNIANKELVDLVAGGDTNEYESLDFQLSGIRSVSMKLGDGESLTSPVSVPVVLSRVSPLSSADLNNPAMTARKEIRVYPKGALAVDARFMNGAPSITMNALGATNVCTPVAENDPVRMVEVQVELKDAQGNSVPYNGELTAVFSDDSMVASKNKTVILKEGKGRYTFVPARKAGTLQVRFSDQKSAVKTGAVTIVIEPGTLSKLKFVTESGQALAPHQQGTPLSFDNYLHGEYVGLDVCDNPVNDPNTVILLDSYPNLTPGQDGNAPATIESINTGGLTSDVFKVAVDSEDGRTVDAQKLVQGKNAFVLKAREYMGEVRLVLRAAQFGRDGRLSLRNDVETDELRVPIRFMLNKDLIQKMQPNILYTNLLGGAYGDITQKDFLAGWWMLSGKAQAVTTSTVGAAKQPNVATFMPNGLPVLNDHPDAPSSYRLESKVVANEPFQIEVHNEVTGVKTVSVRYHIAPFASENVHENYAQAITPEMTSSLNPGLYFIPAEGTITRKERVQDGRSIVRIFTPSGNQLMERAIIADNLQFFSGSTVYPELPLITVDQERKDILRLIVDSPSGGELGVLYVKLPNQRIYPTERSLGNDVAEVVLDYAMLNASPLGNDTYGLSESDIATLNQATSLLNLGSVSNAITVFQKKVIENLSEIASSSNGIFFERPLRNLLAISFDNGLAKQVTFADQLLLPLSGIREYVRSQSQNTGNNRFVATYDTASNRSTVQVQHASSKEAQDLMMFTPKWKASSFKIQEQPQNIEQSNGIYGVRTDNRVAVRVQNETVFVDGNNGVWTGTVDNACTVTAGKEPLMKVTKEGIVTLCKASSELRIARTHTYSKSAHTFDVVYTLLENRNGSRELAKVVVRFTNAEEFRVLNSSAISKNHQGVYVEMLQQTARYDSATKSILDQDGRSILSLNRSTFFEIQNTDTYDFVVENSELIQIVIRDKVRNQNVARLTLQPYETPFAVDYNASATAPTNSTSDTLSLGLLSSQLQASDTAQEIQVTDTQARSRVLTLDRTTGTIKELANGYRVEVDRIDNRGTDLFIFAGESTNPAMRMSVLVNSAYVQMLAGEYRSNGLPAVYVAERKPLMDIRQNTSTKEYEIFKGFDLAGRFMPKGGLETVDSKLTSRHVEGAMSGVLTFALDYNGKEFSKAIYKLDQLSGNISSATVSSSNTPSLIATVFTDLFGKEKPVFDGWLYAPFRFIRLADIQASLTELNGYLSNTDITASGRVEQNGKLTFDIKAKRRAGEGEMSIASLTPSIAVVERSFNTVATGTTMPSSAGSYYIGTTDGCAVVRTTSTHQVEACKNTTTVEYSVQKTGETNKTLALSLRSDGSYRVHDNTWLGVSAAITSRNPLKVTLSVDFYDYASNPETLNAQEKLQSRRVQSSIVAAVYTSDNALLNVTTNALDVNKYSPAGTYLTFRDSQTALYRTLNGRFEYCADKNATNLYCVSLLSLEKDTFMETTGQGAQLAFTSQDRSDWQPIRFELTHTENNARSTAGTIDVLFGSSPLSLQVKNQDETVGDTANIIVRKLKENLEVQENGSQITLRNNGEIVAQVNKNNVQFASLNNVSIKPLSVTKDSYTFEIIDNQNGTSLFRTFIVFNPGIFTTSGEFALGLSNTSPVLQIQRAQDDSINVQLGYDLIASVNTKGELRRATKVPATFVDTTSVTLSNNLILQRIRVGGGEVATHEYSAVSAGTLLQTVATTFFNSESYALQIRTPKNIPSSLSDLVTWGNDLSPQNKNDGVKTELSLSAQDGIVQSITKDNKPISQIKIYTPGVTGAVGSTSPNSNGYDMATSQAVMKLLGGNGIFVQMVDSEEGSLSFGHEVSGNSTNAPYSLVLKDKRIPFIAVGNDDGRIGVEDALSMPGDGVGYKGDFKNMLLFAAGNTVGQSTLPHMTYATINLGDPVVSLQIQEADTTNDYFTDDIGKIVHTHTGSNVQDIELYDYDADGKKDIIYTDGTEKIYAIRNIGTTSLPEWVYEGELLSIPEGIRKLLLLKTTAGDSLMVATSKSTVTSADENSLASLATSNFLELHKDGGGMFSRCSQTLRDLGEVEDMQFGDIDGDGADDIVVVTSKKEIKTVLVRGNEDCLRSAAERFSVETVDKLGMELTGVAEGDMLRLPDTDVYARFNDPSVDQKKNTPIVSSMEAPSAYPANPDVVFVRAPGQLQEGITTDEARIASEQIAALRALLPAGQEIIRDSGPQAAQIAKMFVSAELPYIRSGGIYEMRLNEVLDDLRADNPQSLVPKWLPLGGVVEGVASQVKPVFDFISSIVSQKNTRISVEENLSQVEGQSFVIKKYGKDVNGGYIQQGDKLRYKVTVQNNLPQSISSQTPTTKVFDIADRLERGTSLVNGTMTCTLVSNGAREVLRPVDQKCGPNAGMSDPLFDLYFTDLRLAPGQSLEIEYVVQVDVEPVSIELSLVDFKSYYESFERGLFQSVFLTTDIIANASTVFNKKVITVNTTETQSNGLLTYWRNAGGGYTADILKKKPDEKAYSKRIPIIGDLIAALGLGTLVEGLNAGNDPLLQTALEMLGLAPEGSSEFKSNLADADLNKITNIQQELSDVLKEVFLTSDRDMDGLIDLWDDDVRANPTPNNTDLSRIGSNSASPWQDVMSGASSVLDGIGKQVESSSKYISQINQFLRNNQCNFGGYCPIPNEWNYAIGAPGKGAISMIPANLDIPVFAAPTPAGLVWPPDPTYFTEKNASQVRVYFTPTLTGRFALSICSGPYSLGMVNGPMAAMQAKAGNCLAFLMPDFLGIRELCANLADSLTYFADGSVNLLTRGAYSIARAKKSQSIVPLGGSEIMRDFETSQFVFNTDKLKNPTNANQNILKEMRTFFQEVARLNTNTYASSTQGVPLSVGFPAFIMQWFEKQMDEITTKLLTPPKMYVYLPDPVTGLFIPRNPEMSLNDRRAIGDLTLGERSQDSFNELAKKGGSEAERFLKKEKETQINTLAEECATQTGSACNSSIETAIVTMASAEVNDLRRLNYEGGRTSNVTSQQDAWQQMLSKSTILTTQLATLDPNGTSTQIKDLTQQLQGASLANVGTDFEKYADLVEQGYELVYRKQAENPDTALDMRQTALRYAMYNNDVSEGRRSVEQCYAMKGQGNLACALESAKYSLSSTAETVLWKTGLNSNAASTTAGVLNQGVGIDQIRKRVRGIDEMLDIIGSIPLLSVESRDVVFQFPWISPARVTDMTYSLEAAKNQSLQNFTNFYSRYRECFFEEDDATGDLAFRLDVEPTFTVRPLQSASEGDPYARGGLTADVHAKCLVVAKVAKEGWSGIQGITQNIERLKQYASSFVAIKQFQQWRTYILSQVTDSVASIINQFAVYINDQNRIIRGWQGTLQTLITASQSVQVLVDVFQNFSTRCQNCGSITERGTEYANIMETLQNFIRLDVVPMASWPDLEIDLSSINFRLAIVLPNLRFVPREVSLPRIQAISFPMLDGLNPITLQSIARDGLGIAIPVLPPMPQIPDLPDMPPFQLPKLPDLPPPPTIRQLNAQINISIQTIGRILEMICLLNKNIFPVPESGLRAHIERMTASTFSLKTQTARRPVPVVAGLEKVRLSMDINYYFTLNQAVELTNMLAQGWNGEVNKIVNWSYKYLSQLPADLLNQAGNYFTNEYMGNLVRDMNKKLGDVRNGVNTALQNTIVYPIDNVPELIKQTTDQKLREQQEIQQYTGATIGAADTSNPLLSLMITELTSMQANLAELAAEEGADAESFVPELEKQIAFLHSEEAGLPADIRDVAVERLSAVIEESKKGSVVASAPVNPMDYRFMKEWNALSDELQDEYKNSSDSEGVLQGIEDAETFEQFTSLLAKADLLATEDLQSKPLASTSLVGESSTDVLETAVDTAFTIMPISAADFDAPKMILRDAEVTTKQPSMTEVSRPLAQALPSENSSPAPLVAVATTGANTTNASPTTSTNVTKANATSVTQGSLLVSLPGNGGLISLTSYSDELTADRAYALDSFSGNTTHPDAVYAFGRDIFIKYNAFGTGKNKPDQRFKGANPIKTMTLESISPKLPPVYGEKVTKTTPTSAEIQFHAPDRKYAITADGRFDRMTPLHYTLRLYPTLEDVRNGVNYMEYYVQTMTADALASAPQNKAIIEQNWRSQGFSVNTPGFKERARTLGMSEDQIIPVADGDVIRLPLIFTRQKQYFAQVVPMIPSQKIYGVASSTLLLHPDRATDIDAPVIDFVKGARQDVPTDGAYPIEFAVTDADNAITSITVDTDMMKDSDGDGNAENDKDVRCEVGSTSACTLAKTGERSFIATLMVNYPAQDEGLHTIRVFAEDAMGNKREASAELLAKESEVRIESYDRTTGTITGSVYPPQGGKELRLLRIRDKNISELSLPDTVVTAPDGRFSIAGVKAGNTSSLVSPNGSTVGELDAQGNVVYPNTSSLQRFSVMSFDATGQLQERVISTESMQGISTLGSDESDLSALTVTAMQGATVETQGDNRSVAYKGVTIANLTKSNGLYSLSYVPNALTRVSTYDTAGRVVLSFKDVSTNAEVAKVQVPLTSARTESSRVRGALQTKSAFFDVFSSVNDFLYARGKTRTPYAEDRVYIPLWADESVEFIADANGLILRSKNNNSTLLEGTPMMQLVRRDNALQIQYGSDGLIELSLSGKTVALMGH